MAMSSFASAGWPGLESLWTKPRGFAKRSNPGHLAAPGSTSDASTLSGTWNATTGQADTTWTASTDPNLDDYQVRMSPGATYDAATVVATVPSDTLSLSTTTGLDNPGDVASFKVFVRLNTGNEAGSNTVTITRP